MLIFGLCRVCGFEDVLEVPPPPAEHWPRWARVVRWLWQRPGHAGLGDSFELMAKVIGAHAVSIFLHRHGLDCGCQNRKAWMNASYPYSQ